MLSQLICFLRRFSAFALAGSKKVLHCWLTEFRDTQPYTSLKHRVTYVSKQDILLKEKILLVPYSRLHLTI